MAVTSRQFDGASNYLSNLTGASVTTPPCTLFAWFKPYVVNANMAIVGFSNSSVVTSDVFIYVSSGGKLGAFTQSPTSGAVVFTGSTSITANVWHLAMFLFGNTQAALYLDASLLPETAFTPAASIVAWNRVYIGQEAVLGIPGDYFNGEIGRAGVVSRMITTQEAANLYAGQLPPGCILTNLASSWILDGTSSPEPDTGSANLPLTVNGATTGADAPPAFVPTNGLLTSNQFSGGFNQG